VAGAAAGTARAESTNRAALKGLIKGPGQKHTKKSRPWRAHFFTKISCCFCLEARRPEYYLLWYNRSTTLKIYPKRVL
jgi:hypothetical protein